MLFINNHRNYNNAESKTNIRRALALGIGPLENRAQVEAVLRTGFFPNTRVSLDSAEWLFDSSNGRFIWLPEVLGRDFRMPSDIYEWRDLASQGLTKFEYKGMKYYLCAGCLTWTKYIIDSCDEDDLIFCSYECMDAADYFECARCGELHHVFDRTWVYDCYHDEVAWCDDCSYYHAVRCEECEEWFSEDAIERREDGTRVCDDCARRAELELHSDEHPELHNYGYAPQWKVYGDTNGNMVPTLGIELETDTNSYNVRHEYIDGLLGMEHADRVFFTRDGSLRNGVEVTSHPMTLDEHIGSNIWGEVAEVARKHGFSSHDIGTCGLHIHFNTSFFGKSETVRNVGGYKLVLLAKRFQQQLIAFSRRRNTEWCSFDYSYEPETKLTDKVSVKTEDNRSLVYKARRLKEGNEYAHSMVWNFQHSATIECRLFRGSLNTETIYASMALVQGMARFVKTHSEAYCQSVDWYTLVDWIIGDTENGVARESFASYLNRRGLWHESDDAA